VNSQLHGDELQPCDEPGQGLPTPTPPVPFLLTQVNAPNISVVVLYAAVHQRCRAASRQLRALVCDYGGGRAIVTRAVPGVVPPLLIWRKSYSFARSQFLEIWPATSVCSYLHRPQRRWPNAFALRPVSPSFSLQALMSIRLSQRLRSPQLRRGREHRRRRQSLASVSQIEPPRALLEESRARVRDRLPLRVSPAATPHQHVHE